jgi:hypothetical protein
MIGFPGESRAEIFDTIELNRECKVKDVNCFIFVPYKGTELHRICVQKGYIQPDHIATEHAFSSSLKMPQIFSGELYGLFKTFPLYVKLPKKLWPEIKKAEKNTDNGAKSYQRMAEIYRELSAE